MLNTQIIASQVANLTDARYYAAWGVSFMSFNRNPGDSTYITSADLIEIREWVEGPEFLGEFSGLESSDEIEKIIDEENLSGAIVGPFAPIETINALDVNHLFCECLLGKVPQKIDSPLIIKLKKSELSSLAVTSDYTCYLDIYDVDLDTVKRVIQENNYGLVLRGGEEEKVGFKSFGFLDDVYDLVME